MVALATGVWGRQGKKVPRRKRHASMGSLGKALCSKEQTPKGGVNNARGRGHKGMAAKAEEPIQVKNGRDHPTIQRRQAHK